LEWLKDAGIAVILDHHALPGVQAENQMFAGR
jgi:aryl-phospho-beta-D-glucosidase BglC (GH1 family)